MWIFDCRGDQRLVKSQLYIHVRLYHNAEVFLHTYENTLKILIFLKMTYTRITPASPLDKNHNDIVISKKTHVIG